MRQGSAPRQCSVGALCTGSLCVLSGFSVCALWVLCVCSLGALWMWQVGGLVGVAGWWVQPGPHLLAEEIEAIWMAEVLPGVKHLRHNGKSRDHTRLCPPMHTPALPGPATKTSFKKVVHVGGDALGFWVRISHSLPLPCQSQKPKTPPPCVRTTSRVHWRRRSTHFQRAQGALWRCPCPPWALPRLPEGEENLKMRADGVGTKVPETLILACFSQPPTTSAVTPAIILPLFPVLSFS